MHHPPVHLREGNSNMKKQQLSMTLRCIVQLAPLLVLVSLAACSTSSPEPDATALYATEYVATLTAMPSNTPPPSATSPSTPTETPPPSNTPAPTPTSGPSPTPTMRPLPEGDPRQGLDLNNPHYLDPFDVAFTWVGPYGEHAANVWKENHLEAVDYLTDGYVWWSTTNYLGGNVYAEVSTTIGECKGKDAAGMGIRITPDTYDGGYSLEVSCDGQYRLRRFSPGNITTLIDWTEAAQIVKGPEATNRIGLLGQGASLHVVINDVALDSVQDTTFYAGNFALFANALETAGVKVVFDDFALWYLNP